MENRRKPAPRAATLDINCDCKELVMDYLQAAFPTRAMEVVSDEDGNERSRPLSDADGNPVHSQEALRIREDTLELLGAMPPIAPGACTGCSARMRRRASTPATPPRLQRWRCSAACSTCAAATAATPSACTSSA